MSLDLSGSCCESNGTLSLGLTLNGNCCDPVRVVTTSSGTTPVRDLIRITSADFVSATSWTGTNNEAVAILPAYSLKVFYNDGNRYLDEGTEWTRTSTGFDLIGLDTTTGTMTFYVHINTA